MQQLTETVKQRVRDGVSLAVGVGVLGYQAARTRAEETQHVVRESVKDARATAEQGARRAWDQLEELGTEVRERVEPVIARVSDRVEPLIGDLVERVEPLVDRIQARAKAFGRESVEKAETATASV